ncbi:hypothetical protein AAZX31_11G152500 [Glycine max]|uniref:uncharacterized protein isoform X1 n=1 Tax=Glycine max TaxID=3847 RepID=UPI001B35750D|nr:uncharacterized protein LOC100811814 isoform X1 [Glycine max]
MATPPQWEFSWASPGAAVKLCLGDLLVMSSNLETASLPMQGDMEMYFGSEENASIVYAALAVDKELQPDKVKRLMTVSDGKLSVHFEATEARFLRASFSAFVDVLTLATKTIEEFGQVMKL